MFTKNIWDEFAKMKKKIYEEEESKIRIEGVRVSEIQKYNNDMFKVNKSSISRENYPGGANSEIREKSPSRNDEHKRDKSPKFDENSNNSSFYRQNYPSAIEIREKSKSPNRNDEHKRDKSPKFDENSNNSSFMRQNYPSSNSSPIKKERDKNPKKIEENTKGSNSSFYVFKKKQK